MAQGEAAAGIWRWHIDPDPGVWGLRLLWGAGMAIRRKYGQACKNKAERGAKIGQGSEKYLEGAHMGGDGQACLMGSQGKSEEIRINQRKSE